jgi:hypothetical protein
VKKPAVERRASETDGLGGTSVPSIPPIPHLLSYRLCRRCRRRPRPVVPVGCAAGWDLCAKCFTGSWSARPYPEPDDRPAVDPWEERIAEILADTERRVSV